MRIETQDNEMFNAILNNFINGVFDKRMPVPHADVNFEQLGTRKLGTLELFSAFSSASAWDIVISSIGDFPPI